MSLAVRSIRGMASRQNWHSIFAYCATTSAARGCRKRSATNSATICWLKISRPSPLRCPCRRLITSSPWRPPQPRRCAIWSNIPSASARWFCAIRRRVSIRAAPRRLTSGLPLPRAKACAPRCRPRWRYPIRCSSATAQLTKPISGATSPTLRSVSALPFARSRAPICCTCCRKFVAPPWWSPVAMTRCVRMPARPSLRRKFRARGSNSSTRAGISCQRRCRARSPFCWKSFCRDEPSLSICARGKYENQGQRHQHQLPHRGPDRAPLLVFSNSLATSLLMWDEQAAVLKDRFRVLRYDQRGHGETEAPAARYAFDTLLDDALALMDGLGITKASFAGLSMGGATALGLAARRSDRFERIIIADSPCQSTPQSSQQWEERIAVAQKQGIEALVEPTVARWFPPETVAKNPPYLDKIRAMIRATPVNGFIGCAAALAAHDYASAVGTVKCPVLFLVGEKDAPAPAMRKLHEKLAGS